MHDMKFSLATLLLLVLVAAIGCAALIHANEIWRQSMVTLVVSALLIAALAAAVDRSRLFALGFAVAGWIYLLLVVVPVFDLRDDLLTDKAVRWLLAAIHDEEVPDQGVFKNPLFSPGYVRRIGPDGTTWISDVNAVNAKNTAANFADIGHAVWTLIVACLGGAVASFLARKNNDGC